METVVRIEQQSDGRWLVIAERPTLDLVYGPYTLADAERVAERLHNAFKSENGAVLERVALAVHDTMLADGLIPAACIAGATCIRDLLDGRALGDPIPPPELVAVEVAAFNAPGAELYRQGRLVGTHRAEWEAAGGWSLGLGYGATPVPGGWAGHLVAVVDRRWLVDPTLGQATRPERGLPLPPVMVAPVTERWLRDREDLLVVVQETGVQMTYSVRRGAPDWTGSPDWALPERRQARVASALAALRQEEDNRVLTA